MERLFEEEDISLTDTDKDALLEEMQALIEEQRATIAKLQKKLEREASCRNLGDESRGLCEMKRDALTALWAEHEQAIQKASKAKRKSSKKKSKKKKSSSKEGRKNEGDGRALCVMSKDSLTNLWKQHQKVQKVKARTSV